MIIIFIIIIIIITFNGTSFCVQNSVGFIWIAIEFPVKDFVNGKLWVGQFNECSMDAWEVFYSRIKRDEIQYFHLIMEHSYYFVQRKVSYIVSYEWSF